MIKTKSILERLAKMEEYVKRLKKYQSLTYEQFHQDGETELIVERILEVCCQIAIDVATHLVAATSSKRPKDYEEAIQLLGEVGVLPEDFARSIKGMAGFRNVLVHGYLEIDEDKVYDNMQRGLADFPLFARYVYEWMNRQGLLKDTDS